MNMYFPLYCACFFLNGLILAIISGLRASKVAMVNKMRIVDDYQGLVEGKIAVQSEH